LNNTILKVSIWSLGLLTGALLLAVVGVGIYNSGKMAAVQAAKPEAPSTVMDTEIERVRQQVEAQGSLRSLVTQPLPISSPQTTSQQHLKKELSKRQGIYHSMQDTCNRWTKWYNKDRSENFRINMSISCRDASNYARRELKLNTRSPNYVADAQKKANSKGARILLANNKQPSAQCGYWKAEKDKIQQRLRQGYKEGLGNRLRAKRRELSDLISDNC